MLRDLYGYTQEVIAHTLEITQKTYSRLENDEIQLTPDRTTKLANLYGISRLDLYRFLETDEKVIIQKIADTNHGAFTANGSVVQHQGITNQEREILFQQLAQNQLIIQQLMQENEKLKAGFSL